MAKTLPIRVEFLGGLEALFMNKRNHDIELPLAPSDSQSNNSAPASASVPAVAEEDSLAAPAVQQQKQWTVAHLINHLHSQFLQDSPKAGLFIMDGTVRPGILVLINDADWELEGEGEYKLQSGDQILFVSTLHGG